MSYVRKSLLPGEEIVFQTKLHWFVYLPSVILMPIVIGFALFVITWITRWTSEFAVTNKRVIIKTGWISRNTIEMLLTKVETVDVEQGIIGRIFNFGTIRVVGTGGTREPFKYIARPLELRRAIQGQAP